jgi:5,5'-dehydrodivanillate O-demethylase oxygenase subunit
MTSSDAVDFVHTGPGTVAGNYLRRYWQPVYESAKLAPGRAVQIRVMGENFTLYRGEEGRAHLVGPSCPHRKTQLSLGWIEEDSIRCFYHGWKFDRTGRCVDQPAEPKPFAHKVSIPSYPTDEQLGFVFAYLGTPPAPPLPRWPEFEALSNVSSIAMIPCNYFQSAENIVDDVHVGFVHAPPSQSGRTQSERKPPTVSAEETSHGIRMTYTKPDWVERSYYIMPNSHTVSYYLDYFVSTARKGECRMHNLFWYVPIDDLSHNHVMITAGPPDVIKLIRDEQQTPHDVADDIMAVLAGNANWHKHTTGVRRRPDMVRIQDGVPIVSQGAIVDRRQERLGASDAGVILLRKLWTRELRNVASGNPVTTFVRPPELP